MEISPQSRSKIARFGLFEVDFERYLLTKGGLRIKLQGQPFQVLALLLDRPGELVTREEIRRKLWPDNTYVEFDGGLNTAIKKLRNALNDSADTPRFIETVPRKGYRFLAPIEVSVVPESVQDSLSTVPLPPPVSAPSLDGPSSKSPAKLHSSPNWPVRVVALLLVACTLMLILWMVARTKATQRPIQSIAVMPMQSLSSDPAQEYFSDGMTDEIITDLAKIRSLRVISRTSMMHYKGTLKSIPEVARELHVDAILEGSVSRSPDRVHIRAQLIRAEPEEHIWAETYDRPQKDEVTLQGELAQQIASAIRAELTEGERADLARPRTVDPEAHSLYLRGRYFWNKRDLEGFKKAAEYFQAAIQRDPNYAAAYAGLADAYLFQGQPGGQKQAAAKARPFAEKALQLDDHLAEAHASLGLIARDFDWDWPEMERRLRRALEINPNYATAHQWYGDGYLTSEGRIEESLIELRKAQQLDPLSAIIAADIAKQLYYLRRYDEAIAQIRTVFELDPKFLVAHLVLERCYVAKGMYDEAASELEAVKDAMEPGRFLNEQIYVHARGGRKEQAKRELAALLNSPALQSSDPAFIAMDFAGLEDRGNAFQWLDKARLAGSPPATGIKVDVVWDPLRSDSRYGQFLKNMRLDSN